MHTYGTYDDYGSGGGLGQPGDDVAPLWAGAPVPSPDKPQMPPIEPVPAATDPAPPPAPAAIAPVIPDWVTMTQAINTLGPARGLDEADRNFLVAFFPVIPNLTATIIGLPTVAGELQAEWQMLQRLDAAFKALPGYPSKEAETVAAGLAPVISAVLAGYRPDTFNTRVRDMVQKSATALLAAQKAGKTAEQLAAEAAWVAQWAAKLQATKPEGKVSTTSFGDAVAKLEAAGGGGLWKGVKIIGTGLIVILVLYLLIKLAGR